MFKILTICITTAVNGSSRPTFNSLQSIPRTIANRDKPNCVHVKTFYRVKLSSHSATKLYIYSACFFDTPFNNTKMRYLGIINLRTN